MFKQIKPIILAFALAPAVIKPTIDGAELRPSSVSLLQHVMKEIRMGSPFADVKPAEFRAIEERFTRLLREQAIALSKEDHLALAMDAAITSAYCAEQLIKTGIDCSNPAILERVRKEGPSHTRWYDEEGIERLLVTGNTSFSVLTAKETDKKIAEIWALARNPYQAAAYDRAVNQWVPMFSSECQKRLLEHMIDKEVANAPLLAKIVKIIPLSVFPTAINRICGYRKLVEKENALDIAEKIKLFVGAGYLTQIAASDPNDRPHMQHVPLTALLDRSADTLEPALAALSKAPDFNINSRHWAEKRYWGTPLHYLMYIAPKREAAAAADSMRQLIGLLKFGASPCLQDCLDRTAEDIAQGSMQTAILGLIALKEKVVRILKEKLPDNIMQHAELIGDYFGPNTTSRYSQK